MLSPLAHRAAELPAGEEEAAAPAGGRDPAGAGVVWIATAGRPAVQPAALHVPVCILGERRAVAQELLGQEVAFEARLVGVRRHEAPHVPGHDRGEPVLASRALRHKVIDRVLGQELPPRAAPGGGWRAMQDAETGLPRAGVPGVRGREAQGACE